MARPPKIVIPGLNRGAGIPPGFVLGRARGTGKGPAQLLNLTQMRAIGIATAAGATTSTSIAISTAQSLTASLSSVVSGSISTVTSQVTSLSTAVSTVDSNQSTSLSQISSSLSGAISTNVGQSTSLSQISSSLSSAISTNTDQSTSLSQISSSLSGAISSTASLSTAVSTVISGSVSTLNSRIDSLSTAIGAGGGGGFITLDVDSSDAGNSGTTETDLFSFTLAAGQLGQNADRVDAHWAGTFVSSATATRQLRAYFGGTLIFDTGALTLSLSSAWVICCAVTRVSASVVRCDISMTTEGAALASYTEYTEVTGLTLANTQIIKLTGTAAGAGAASNDIVGSVGAVEFRPAGGSGGSGFSTSLSQISSSLSSEISSRTSGDTSLSTVISGSISTVNSSITSLSTVVSGSISTVNSSITSLSTAIGGRGRDINLGTMRALTDFTQINISGNRTVTEVSGKAITIKESSPDTTLRIVGLTRAMPSTTSRVAIYVQGNFMPRRFQGISFGFSDGTKYHVYVLFNASLTIAAGNIEQQTWSNSTSRASAVAVTNTAAPLYYSTGFWLGIRVDATAGKAYWEASSDGVNFATIAVVTMSSGYLGSSGYTNAFCGLFAYNQDAGGTDYPASNSILDWDENGLSRTFA